MVRRVFNKENWKEIEEAFVRGNVQYYYLRVDNREDGEQIISLEDIYDHYPTDEDKTNLYISYLNMCKNVAKHNVVNYANTDNIKEYYINDVPGWENSETRLSIRQAALDKEKLGIEEYTLYHGGTGFTMQTSKVDEILSQVEVYASACYDITEQHKVTIDSITIIEEAENYDYTKNYPEKLNFSI